MVLEHALPVEWTPLEDHRELLHSCDDPFPVVEHVSEVLTATPTRA